MERREEEKKRKVNFAGDRYSGKDIILVKNIIVKINSHDATNMITYLILQL